MARGRPLPFEVLDAVLRMFVLDRLTIVAIRKALGVSRTTVLKWLRILDIVPGTGMVGGMELTISTTEPVASPTRRYRRLTLDDRVTIQAGLQSNPPLSIRAIAAELGVSPSTVSREVSRHRIQEYEPFRAGITYSAAGAHGRACAIQSRKPARPKRLSDPWLRAYVIDCLNDRMSPEQIAGRLRYEYPERKDLHVSHETIYQALYVQGRGSLREELAVAKALRTGRTARKPRSKLPRRTARPWLEGALLADRPPEAADRAVPGHWEGDLVVDSYGGGLITLVERRSRFTLVRKLPGTRESLTVTRLVEEMLLSLPGTLFRTLTWDQGQEMAEHARITIATDCKVYFCDPHSPWQRPTNENTNGLIRDYYPKGTRFDDSITDEDIQAMQDQLNRRPRKIHGYATPAEKLNDIILAEVS